MPEVRIDVYADQHGAPEELNKTKESLAGVESQGERTSAGLNRLWLQFAKGEIAVDLAKKALHIGWSELKSTVEAAAEAERVERSLSAALEITGRSTPVQEFTEYASSLQSMTVYDDEAIAGTEALLVQMTKLDDEGLKKATRGAIGLASVFGMDLLSAGQLVQKALEGNTAALSRYGIRIDETLPKAEKQRQIMERLGEMYKRAEAEVDTYSGRVKQLGNAYDDFKEALGTFAIKNEATKETLSGMTAIIEYLKMQVTQAADKVDKGGQSWIKFIQPVGMVITVTKAWGDAAREALAAEAAWIEELNSHVKAWSNWHGWLEKDNAALAALGTEVDSFMGKLKPVKSNIVGLTEDQAEFLKNLKVGFSDEVRGKISEAEATLAAYQATGRSTTGGVKILRDYIDGLKESLTGTSKATDKMGETFLGVGWGSRQKEMRALYDALWPIEKVTETSLPRISAYSEGFDDLRVIAAATNGTLSSLGGAFAGLRSNTQISREIHTTEVALNAMRESGQYTAEEIWEMENRLKKLRAEAGETTGWEKFKASALTSISVVANALSAVSSSITNAEEIRVENWYKKRLDYINKTISNETKKEKAISALEAEYEIKRTAAKRKAAIADKAVAAMNTIVNTAQGVTSALAMFPPNPVLATYIKVMGALQLGIIAGTPIPLAKGALFSQRTVLPTGYEVAEAGSREIVSPEPLMRQIVRQESRTMNENVNLHVHFNIQALDGASVEQMLRTTGIPMIQQALDRRVLRVAQA